MNNSLVLADWVCSLDCSRFNEAVIAKTRDHLLDFLGVMLAGAAEEESAKIAFDYAAGQGSGPSLLLRKGAPRVTAESAAFAHAVAGHSIEMDDVHNASSIHPGVAVIPAALAVAEECGASGAKLMEAIVAGYEIILRAGEAADPSAVYARNFHPTAVCGVFSSAAAAGKLMGLSPEQMANALGLAWSFASGNMSFQAEGSWAKRMQVGNTARAGVMAARLAALGATGPRCVFSDIGFFKGYSGVFRPEKLTAGLGEKLKIEETGLKPYACCRYNQTPVDGLIELREKHALAPEQIERIDLEIASTGLPLVAIPAEAKRAPTNSVEAQFSLYYSAAIAVVAGRAGREEYREPWLSDRRVHDLAARVNVGSNPEVDALYPALWPARILLRMRDGREIEYFSRFCLGDPEKPLGRAGTDAKFRGLSAGSLSISAQDAVIDVLNRVESIRSVSEITRPILG